MACTRTLKIALAALLFLAGLLIVDIASQARERGFSTVAGDVNSRSGIGVSREKVRGYNRKLRKLRRKANRSLHDTLFYIEGTELLKQRNSEAEIRRSSHLRNKVNISPRRSASKIIRVSDEMKRLGEERAANREVKMRQNIDDIEFGFYRESEAYDVRFPSIVYLELIKK